MNSKQTKAYGIATEELGLALVDVAKAQTVRSDELPNEEMWARKRAARHLKAAIHALGWTIVQRENSSTLGSLEPLETGAFPVQA